MKATRVLLLSGVAALAVASRLVFVSPAVAAPVPSSAAKVEKVPGPDFQPVIYFSNQRAAYQRDKAAHPEKYATTSAKEPEWFFTGKPYDADSKSYFFKYRNYRPDSASWMTPDPAGFPDGPNNYRYAPNPLSQVDRLGLVDIAVVDDVTAHTWHHMGADDFLDAKDYFSSGAVTVLYHGQGFQGLQNDILNAANYYDEYGLIDCLYFYGHGIGSLGGSDEQQDVGDGYTIDAFDLAPLKDYFSDDGWVSMMGCQVGNNPGYLQACANAAGVPVDGETGDLCMASAALQALGCDPFYYGIWGRASNFTVFSGPALYTSHTIVKYPE